MSEFGEPYGSAGNQRTGWAQLSTGETVQLAGIGARFGARVLDAIIMLAIMGGLYLLLLAVLSANSPAGSTADFVSRFYTVLLLGFLAAGVVVIGYEVAQIALWGQTLGKRMTGVKVIHEAHGGVPGWGKAFGRWAVPSLAVLLPLIGWLMSLLCYLSLTWDRVRQGWHDKAAGTLVIKA